MATMGNEDKPVEVSRSEFRIIDSSRNKRGYAPTKLITPGTIIETPKDFIGVNYANPGEKPNVVLLANGNMMATEIITPHEEFLAPYYGKGYVGPSYIGAWSAKTFGLIPPPPIIQEKRKTMRERVRREPRQERVREPNQQGSEAERQREEDEEIFSDLRQQHQYAEYTGTGIGRSRSRGRQHRGGSLREDIFMRDLYGSQPYKQPLKVKPDRPRPEPSPTSVYRPAQPQWPQKRPEQIPRQQIQERFFGGDTTRLYRVQGGRKGVAFADVPKEYLNELERRKKTVQPIQSQQRRQIPPRRPRAGIFELPRVGNFGYHGPARRPQPVKKRSRKS